MRGFRMITVLISKTSRYLFCKVGDNVYHGVHGDITCNVLVHDGLLR